MKARPSFWLAVRYFLALLTPFAVACQSPQKTREENKTSSSPTVRLNLQSASAPTAFVAHDNYLSMTLPFAPFREIYDQLSVLPSIGKLISRGEAHVTVLTPPEFDLLKAHVSIDEINEIANNMKIQNTELKPVCLGEGRAVIDGVQQSTYFVVVRAEGLFKIRRAIADLYERRDVQRVARPGTKLQGNSEAAFHADHFYPHVTIGFTKTDLFEQQGVIKDDRSCINSLDTY